MDSQAEDDVFSVTSYTPYPDDQPFVNDVPVPRNIHSTDSFPENNRQAILSAMRKLQDKIRRLDLEKMSAQSHLHILSHEIRHPRSDVTDEGRTGYNQNVSLRQTEELASQLNLADSRCSDLEKRLNEMQNTAPQLDKQPASFNRDFEPPPAPGPHSRTDEHLRKISELEHEHQLLRRSHVTAQDKLRELEGRLNDEQITKNNTEEPKENGAVPKLVDFDFHSFPHTKRKIARKKNNVRANGVPCPDPCDHLARHYRIKLTDIPFVAGQSTAASHSFGANLQRVISLMKSHNKVLCSRASRSGGGRSRSANGLTNDVQGILQQLQNEFHALARKHDDLLVKMNEVSTKNEQMELLQKQLEDVIRQMESKTEQIDTLIKCYRQGNTKGRSHSAPGCHNRTTITTRTTQRPAEVKVTTTIQSNKEGSLKVIPNTKYRVDLRPSLTALRCIKKLQTRLQPNDLRWK